MAQFDAESKPSHRAVCDSNGVQGEDAEGRGRATRAAENSEAIQVDLDAIGGDLDGLAAGAIEGDIASQAIASRVCDRKRALAGGIDLCLIDLDNAVCGQSRNSQPEQQQTGSQTARDEFLHEHGNLLLSVVMRRDSN